MRPIDADKLKFIVRGLPLDGTITMFGATNVIHAIDSMPTVPLRKHRHRHRIAHKHGHWIAVKGWNCYECSECSGMQASKSNYCPRCGIRMDDEVTE